MACIEKIYSVSALVGDGRCNGQCSFCAGAHLRPQARELHDPVKQLQWKKNYQAAIRLSARYGGWSLSLTSSGEPTCCPDDVTRALELYRQCAQQGAYFPNVNLFTNGILLGNDVFCDKYLPRWKELGLTNIAVSVHSTSRHEQADAYGLHSTGVIPGAEGQGPNGLRELIQVPTYPDFSKVFGNIRKHGLGVRVTLLLRKGAVDNARAYRAALTSLRMMQIDNVASWPVANPDGSRSAFTPSRLGLVGIRAWLWKNAKLCHGHAWGGGVYDWEGMMVRLTDYVTKHDPKKDFVRQLVVFQDATVAYSWIREGALCMK